MSFDVIVIGAGHNGLVCAARLAKAGRRVLVLERRDKAGGLCATDEFHPGFSAPGPLHDTRGLNQRVVDALKLTDHGLTWANGNPVQILLPNGRQFTLGDGELDGVESADNEAYAAWRTFIGEVSPVLRYVAERPPPPLHPQDTADFWALALSGMKLRKLGKRRMVELIRVAPMAAADWLNEYFPDPSVSEALLGPSLLGLFMGPWSAGTAFNLLLKESLRGNAVEGGPAAVTDALLGACQSAGVEIRLNQSVRRISVHDGRVSGVRTAEGEKIEATAVAAACDPRTAMLELVDPAELDLKIDHQFRCLRTRGTAAKVNLAVRGPPAFSNARLTTGSLDNLERAFDAVKYDQYSENPFLDITTLTGSRFAPEGHHVMSILAGYAPYAPREGWSLEQEDHLAGVILDRIALHVPDIRDRIIAREVIMPADIEQRYGVNGGQIQHVEPALDQTLSMRPTISTSRYATPLDGLFLASAGCHPVGGVSGLPGLLAADTIKTVPGTVFR
jgi:phytoene dehydrogenase-like protein